jgi:hypothetical protein
VISYDVGSSGQGSYVINGQPNPTLTLTHGQTYTFNVTVPDHPFWIKTLPEIGFSDIFSAGVTNNGASPGVVTFTVPASAPALLYYQCQYHEPMNGMLTITSAPPSATGAPATTGPTLGLLGVGLALLGLLPLSLRYRRKRASS